jgi:hypothetical protein
MSAASIRTVVVFRPVRPEKAEDRPGFDGDREALDRDPAVEPPRQSMRLDRVRHASRKIAITMPPRDAMDGA